MFSCDLVLISFLPFKYLFYKLPSVCDQPALNKLFMGRKMSIQTHLVTHTRGKLSLLLY